MTEIPSKDWVRKKIIVTDWFLYSDGMEVSYNYNGKDLLLFANPPEQAAELLKKSFYINDYCGAGDQVIIELEVITDEIGEQYQKTPWNEFVKQFEFSQYDAICILTDFEYAKAVDAAYDIAFQTSKNSWETYVANHMHINENFLG